MKKRKTKNFGWEYLFYLFSLIFFSYFFFFFKFSNLRVTPPEALALGEKYFLNQSLFSIILNQRKLIKEENEVMEVNVKPIFFQKKIEVSFKIAKPIALIYDARSDEFFYLDNYGRITKNLKPKSNLLTIISFKKIKNNSFLNPKLKSLLDLLLEFSSLYFFQLKKIIIHSNFDVSVINQSNQQFFFDPHKNLDEQIKKLYIFLEYQKNQNLQNISRIDLRIPQKIYFK